MIHIAESRMDQILEKHETESPFKHRPLTNNAVRFIEAVLPVSTLQAFFALQFLLAFLCGPALVAWLRSLEYSPSESLWGMSLFYFSMPLLLAHFEPIYTYDDLWVYLFVPLAMTLLRKRDSAWSAILLCWALIARSTSLVFLPCWVVLAVVIRKQSAARAALWGLAVLGLFLIARMFFFRLDPAGIEYKLAWNFEDGLRTSDTLFSVIVGQGILWLGLAALWIRDKQPLAKPLLLCAVISLVGYYSSTLLFAQARETRLFFPPFVFTIPLLLLVWRELKPAWLQIRRRWSAVSISGITAVILAVSGVVASLVFPDFEFRTWPDGNRALLSVHLGALLGAAVLYRYKRRI